MRHEIEVRHKLAQINGEISIAIEQNKPLKALLLQAQRSILLWVLSGDDQNEE